MADGKERSGKCRYGHRPAEGLADGLTDKLHCSAGRKDGGEVKEVSEADCASCGDYSSRYIEYPITVNSIENGPFSPQYGPGTGKPCEVCPCGEEYGGKTYLGIYLGGLPCFIRTSYDPESGVVRNTPVNNPAIFVPELKKIVSGMESWWRAIENPEGLKGISREDIENTWYVKFLGMGGMHGEVP